MKRILLLTLILMATLLNSNLTQAKSFKAEEWLQSDDDSTATIDHSGFQVILDEYLVTDHQDGINLFRYDAVEGQHKTVLENYIQSMSALDPQAYNQAEQMAYWINLYNALTVNLIIDRDPSYSILTAGKGLLPNGPWDEKLIVINDTALTLNNIEHDILRPQWQDHRIHFAVNCASLGCPDLQATVFTAENVDDMLDEGAVAFLTHPRGLEFKKGKLYLSKIFSWYEEDFGEAKAEVLETLSEYLPDDLADVVSNYDGKIKYQYDWSLNKAR